MLLDKIFQIPNKYNKVWNAQLKKVAVIGSGIMVQELLAILPILG
jgi:hypothetical protein